ncbi:MAG: flippase activity-associated protein Agl23 [Opitutales bacterium]
MQRRIFIGIAWIAVMALALWLRIDDLEARPIHADEATGAYFLSQRLENSGYRFDPTHFHGPLLSLISTPLAKIFGQHNWLELSLGMLRLGPVVAGLLTVLTPLLWLRRIGPVAALGAGALLASSPLLVYYNRMFIHESWLVLFGMLTAAAVYEVIHRPNRKRALLAGLAAGLMFATKSTVAISLLSWCLAGGCCWLLLRRDSERLEQAPTFSAYLKPALWFALALLATGTLFYTNGFRQPGGIVDAIRTYFVYETTPGHDKPMGYYFELLVWPKQMIGMRWSEAGVALLGMLTCLSVIRRKERQPLIAFMAIGVLLHLLIYSLISYKTPWLMSLPWALACLLAGCVFSRNGTGAGYAKSLLLYAGFGLILIFQTYQSMHSSGRLANHPDNPYVYVPTSKNMVQLPSWLADLEAFQGGDLGMIAVVGQGYWPLPWYLRGFGPVGYWPEAPEGLSQFPLVFSLPENTPACRELLEETHTQLPRSLRHNVPLNLFLSNDIWKAWTEQ